MSRAEPKRIGEEVEDVVDGLVDALEPAGDPDDTHDLVATRAVYATEHLALGTAKVLTPETEVEVKAAKVSVSNGTNGERPGLWMFKGRDDGQHAKLLERDAAYLLAVYEEAGENLRVRAMMAVPASVVDELLGGSWYESGRCEGYVAQLAWPRVDYFAEVLRS